MFKQSLGAIAKNSNLEYSSGLVVVRDVTAADSSSYAPTDPLLPGIDDTLAALFTATANNQNVGLINTNGARHMLFRVWGKKASASAGTVRIAFRSYPHQSPQQLSATNSSTAVRGKGDTILDVTLSVDGSTTANINPATGEAVSSSTFYEASTVSATTSAQENRVRYSSSAGTATELTIILDVYGAKRIYPQIMAVGGAATPSRVIVAACPLD